MYPAWLPENADGWSALTTPSAAASLKPHFEERLIDISCRRIPGHIFRFSFSPLRLLVSISLLNAELLREFPTMERRPGVHSTSETGEKPMKFLVAVDFGRLSMVFPSQWQIGMEC